jgi:hypothetical protein
MAKCAPNTLVDRIPVLSGYLFLTLVLDEVVLTDRFFIMACICGIGEKNKALSMKKNNN